MSRFEHLSKAKFKEILANPGYSLKTRRKPPDEIGLKDTTPTPKASPTHVSATDSRKRQRGRSNNDLQCSMVAFLLSLSDTERIEEQPEPLVIAYRCTYRPDVKRFLKSGAIEYWESKEYWWKIKDDGGLIKLKVAANMYRQHAFFCYEHGKDKQIWIYQMPSLGERIEKKVHPSEFR